MKKRILIGYADYGSGHKSVAQYVKNYFEEKGKYEVMILNITEYSNSIGKLSNKIFNHANKNEFLFSLFFGLSNNKVIGFSNEKLCLKFFDNDFLRKVINDFNPDIVISTHFYVSYLASFYNKEGVINSKIMTIITDFYAHRWWTINHKDVDYFIVSNEIIKNQLIEKNIDSKKIYPFGTPINNYLLSNLEDTNYILKKYSLDGEKPIYLFFGGGTEGYDYVFDYFKTLLKKNYNIDVVFIAGKNKNLKIRCENYLIQNNIKNVIVLGYTKDIFNLLKISSVVITKPGGSTLNECILMKKPCILIPGVGGQENHNARYMTKKHFAVRVRSPYGLQRKVKLFLNYPFIIKSMKNKLDKINNNDSCKKVYDLVDSELSKK